MMLEVGQSLAEDDTEVKDMLKKTEEDLHARPVLKAMAMAE